MSWPLIPRLTGMRSPRLWCAPSSSGSSEKPPLALALEPRSARLRALTVLGADRAAGLQARGALEALDRAQRCPVPNWPSILTLKPALPERLLELADVGPGGAGPQRAVAEMRCLAVRLRQRARRGDGGHAKGEHGNDRNQRTTKGRRHDG